MTRRAAVIGCGFIGAAPVIPGSGIQSHAAAWSHHPGVDLVALADRDHDRLQAASARWSVRSTYPTAAALLAAAAPEVVSLCTPDASHADILDLVLDTPSVRAVLAEKPLALEVDQAEALVAKAEARKIVLAVNYVRRFAPSHQLLRRWLLDEPIGKIELVRGTYVRGIKHNGTHWLDLARYLIGEITEVRGSGLVDDGAVDATIDVELGFACGARGVLSGLRHGSFAHFEIDLIGTRGRVRVIDSGQRIEVFTAATSRRFPGFRELLPAPGPTGGLSDLLMHAAGDLVESLATGRPPACTGEDAVKALTLADRALADAQRRWEDHATIGR
jgi:predicted dehydrogenase